ncbi:hypothetical protein GCM10007298_44300 [Williamsia phyllosphaerae]|uniref:Uncharacterized protein n=1 Tax=Williamsia phyllosphaerae TaxID=885042 RepID=A0ABQ1V871_9NOCA|nr:hypothetical protein GCM10007298_44300 [Williamsia phyllosphaerae]
MSPDTPDPTTATVGDCAFGDPLVITCTTVSHLEKPTSDHKGLTERSDPPHHRMGVGGSLWVKPDMGQSGNRTSPERA